MKIAQSGFGSCIVFILFTSIRTVIDLHRTFHKNLVVYIMFNGWKYELLKKYVPWLTNKDPLDDGLSHTEVQWIFYFNIQQFVSFYMNWLPFNTVINTSCCDMFPFFFKNICVLFKNINSFLHSNKLNIQWGVIYGMDGWMAGELRWHCIMWHCKLNLRMTWLYS